MSDKDTGGNTSADTGQSDEQAVIHMVGEVQLRDYFAAKAMQGSLANESDITEPEVFAWWCYKMADLMLEARKQ